VGKTRMAGGVVGELVGTLERYMLTLGSQPGPGEGNIHNRPHSTSSFGV